MWSYNYTYWQSDEIWHSGILGMKWGVRRYQNKDGSLTSRGKARRSNSTDDWSDDAKTAKSLRKKNINQMSNAELRALNERSRLTNEYQRLNPGKIQKGLAYVAATAGILGTVAGLYDNSNKVVKAGRDVAPKLFYGLGKAAPGPIKRKMAGAAAAHMIRDAAARFPKDV